MTDLSGKAAIVTGGAGGMGRAHALRLASLGANVAIFDKDLEVARRFGEKLSASSVVDELLAFGRQAMAIQADLASADQAGAAVEKVRATFGRLDIVINNAGGAITPIENSTASLSSPEDTQKLFEANFLTTLNMCQATAPLLQRPGGVVVNIITIGAEIQDAAGRYALYGAAKAAVLKYSNTLAVELAPDGVRVNCISPGLIETARVVAQATKRNLATSNAACAIPLRRLGTIEDVVGVMEFLVSDSAAYVTGECIRVAGGLGLVTA